VPPTKQPELETPESPQVQTVILQPVQSATWERDQRIRAASARRRDPDAHVTAQANLDAMPKVNVVFEPNDDERRHGEAHLDSNGEPQYPNWECTYNGLRLQYPMGVEAQVPQVIWEMYAHSRRLPRHRTIRSAMAGVFSREIADEGSLVTSDADFGR
jgi:hypothetical protein